MTEDQATGLNIYRLIWKRKKFIILFVFIISVFSIVVSLLLPKWYRASTVILSPSSGMGIPFGSMSVLGNLGMGDIFGSNENQNRYLSILKSRSLVESVVNKYDLLKQYKCENMENAIRKLKKNYHVSIGEELQISISLYDQDQDKVADMTNYVVFCLDSINNLISQNKAKNIRGFIGDRMNEIIDSLIFLESEISDFMKDERLLNLEDQVSAGVMNAAELKFELIKKEIELTVAQKNYESDNPYIKGLSIQIEGIQGEYEKYFGDESTDNLFLNFLKVPELGLKINQFERKVKYFTTLIEYLGPQYEKAKIDEQKNIPTVQVVDKAVRPERKAKPRRAKIVIFSFFASLIISVYFSYFSSKWKEYYHQI